MKNPMIFLVMMLGLLCSFASPTPLYAESKKHHNLTVLGEMRSALSIYYGEHDGVYPDSLMELVRTGVIKKIPSLETMGRRAWRVTNYKDDACKPKSTGGRTIIRDKIKDTGGWGYIIAPTSPECHGMIFIDSLEMDPDGEPWCDR